MSSDREVWDRGTWRVCLMVARRHREIRLCQHSCNWGSNPRPYLKLTENDGNCTIVSAASLFAFSLPLSSICTWHRCVFMSVSQTFAFLPRGHLFLSEASAFIRLKCHGGFLSSFFPLFLLSNDPFCQSKQFAIKPPPLASLCFFS